MSSEKIVFLETSALVSILFDEPSAPDILNILNRNEIMIASSLALIESGRAITRAESLRRITGRDANRLRRLLRSSSEEWQIIELNEHIVRRAQEPFPVEPIRTLDALHLATLEHVSSLVPSVEVLTLDRRIRENATALGCTLIQ